MDAPTENKFAGHKREWYVGEYYSKYKDPPGGYISERNLFYMDMKDLASLVKDDSDCSDSDCESDEESDVDYNTEDEKEDKERKKRMLDDFKKFSKEENKRLKQSHDNKAETLMHLLQDLWSWC